MDARSNGTTIRTLDRFATVVCAVLLVRPVCIQSLSLVSDKTESFVRLCLSYKSSLASLMKKSRESPAYPQDVESTYSLKRQHPAGECLW